MFLGTNCIKVAPESAIKFYAYEYAKSLICADPDAVQARRPMRNPTGF